MFQLSTNVFNQKGLSFMTFMIADISKRFRVYMASLTENRVFVVQNRLALFLGQNIFYTKIVFKENLAKHVSILGFCILTQRVQPGVHMNVFTTIRQTTRL